MIIINILFVFLNGAILYMNLRASKTKVPKWEYFKDGIRFFNKNGDATIENDKPLIK